MLLTDYASSSSHQPLRAIMDKTAAGEGYSNNHNGSNNAMAADIAQNDYDGALIDLQR